MTTRQRRAERQRNTSNTNMPSDHVGVLIASLVMIAIGWGGLFQLVTSSLPRIGGEMWLFFLLLQIAVTGTVLPIVRYINVRFTSTRDDVPPGGVIVRQSIWIGLFVVTCAWLQIPRALTIPIAIFIAIVLGVVEALIRVRELSAERY